MKVDFYKHNITEEEINAVSDVMRSVFLTTGPRTKEFEQKFADFLGVKYSVGSTSWTNAAFLVLKAWNIGSGDEVIVPSMSFISTANVVLHAGATPVFCDSEAKTGNIDLDKLGALITDRTKAIIPVHLYGQMVDMKKLKSIIGTRDIKILEDCAHCIEGSRDGYKPGNLGDAAVFSFYATKNITCGEGGAIALNDEEVLNRLALLRLHGMSKSAADRYHSKYKHYDMELLGYKANMNDLQAAMLIPQIDKMHKVLERKEQICRYYEDRLRAASIEFPVVESGSVSARHLFTFWTFGKDRDTVLAGLQEKNIGVAVNFRAIHRMKFYQEYFGSNVPNLPVAERIGENTITVPMYPKLTDAEVEYVADSIVECMKK